MENTHAELCGCQPACAFCHGLLHVNCSPHQFDLVLLWAQPLHSSPYRPCASRAYSIIICASLLLTAGDIELNTGPQLHPATGTIRFGYININSAITKSSLIHDLISSFSLDISSVRNQISS
jgi:hypothetical protein